MLLVTIPTPVVRALGLFFLHFQLEDLLLFLGASAGSRPPTIAFLHTRRD